MKRKPRHAAIHWSTQKNNAIVEERGSVCAVMQVLVRDLARCDDGTPAKVLSTIVEMASELSTRCDEHVSLYIDGVEHLCLPDRMGWWPDVPEELLASPGSIAPPRPR